MAIAAATIDDFFKQLAWPNEKKDDHNWVTGFKGDNYTFNFSIRTTDTWLYVYAPFPIKVKPEARANLYEHLLRLNKRVTGSRLLRWRRTCR